MMKEKCPLHDDSMSGIHSAITVVEGKIDKIIELINGSNGFKGLKVEIDRNTQFREEHETGERLWKKVLPSAVTGIIVGILMLAFSLLTAVRADGAALEEIWLSGSIRENAAQRTEWEIAAGFGKNQLLLEREMTGSGSLKTGWGYDLRLERKYTWLRAAFSDIYRQVPDVSLQAQSIALGKDLRLGYALAGNGWDNWRGMGLLEIDYSQGWMDLKTQYMTDLSQYRWYVSGGMAVPLSARITFGPQLDYSGTEEITIGRGKLKLVYRFDKGQS